MADPFVAEIRIFPFNFAPKGWAWCDGQLLPLSQNTALFSLLGTTYGGDGKSQLRPARPPGRAPDAPGPGTRPCRCTTSARPAASETVTLLESEIPSHSHALRADAADAGGDQRAGGRRERWRARRRARCTSASRNHASWRSGRRSHRPAATSRTTTCSRT